MKHLLAVVVLALALGNTFGENAELFTRVYTVPSTFLEDLQPSGDPFAPPLPKKPKKTVQEILSQNGITFGEGGSAIYNPSTSQLIVRNTLEQMHLVEQIIEALREEGSRQILIQFSEATFAEGAVLGKDISELWSFFDPTIPPSEKAATTTDREKFFEELSQPPQATPDPSTIAASGISGVLTDPQFQAVKKAVVENPHIEFSSLPSVMIRSGQPGMVQVNDQRYGVIALPGADNAVLELAAYLPPHGQALYEAGEERKPSFHVTVWDGQTVVYSENLEGASRRLVFVHARLYDPAGNPINPVEEEKEQASVTPVSPMPLKESFPAPEKEAPSEALSPEVEESIRSADEAALRGVQNMEEEDYAAAVGEFARARQLLPDHPVTGQRKDAYTQQLARARDLLAEAAAEPVESHVVKEGETLFQIARDYKVTTDELRSWNRHHSDVIKVGQILLLPEKRVQGNLFPERTLESTLERVVIREVNLQEATLSDALARFRRDLIDYENPLLPEIDAQLVLHDAEDFSDTKITLRLSHVPASVALRYITSLAKCTFEVQENQIIVSPQS